MPGLGGVVEDVMAALHPTQLPAIGFQGPDQVCAFHGGYYTYQWVLSTLRSRLWGSAGMAFMPG